MDLNASFPKETSEVVQNNPVLLAGELLVPLLINDLNVVVDEIHIGEHLPLKGAIVKIPRGLDSDMDRFPLQLPEKRLQVIGVEGTLPAGKGYTTPRSDDRTSGLSQEARQVLLQAAACR